MRLLTIAAGCGLVLWIPLMLLKEVLLKAGILNTKDLSPLIGQERGSPSEYLLNVWHWDGAVILLFLLAVPSFVALIFLLLVERRQHRS